MSFDVMLASAYFAGWRIVRWLPEKTAYKIFYWIGEYLAKKDGKSVQRLRSNLARVRTDLSEKEMDALVIKSMRSYLRYWCDTFRSPDWSSARILSTVTVTNEELLTKPISSGRGVIVSLPHAGNWDLAGSYFCAKGIALVTVVERLKPEALFQKFLAYRQAIGMEVLPLDGRSMATLSLRAREGKLIALIADRDLSSSGVDVTFFGGPARMPAGPALLALKTGAVLLTAFVSYTPDGIQIEFAEIELPTLGSDQEKINSITQLCADNFARGITQYPHDWHMLQRIWIDGDFAERE